MSATAPKSKPPTGATDPRSLALIPQTAPVSKTAAAVQYLVTRSEKGPYIENMLEHAIFQHGVAKPIALILEYFPDSPHLGTERSQHPLTKSQFDQLRFYMERHIFHVTPDYTIDIYDKIQTKENVFSKTYEALMKWKHHGIATETGCAQVCSELEHFTKRFPHRVITFISEYNGTDAQHLLSEAGQEMFRAMIAAERILGKTKDAEARVAAFNLGFKLLQQLIKQKQPQDIQGDFFEFMGKALMPDIRGEMLDFPTFGMSPILLLISNFGPEKLKKEWMNLKQKNFLYQFELEETMGAIEKGYGVTPKMAIELALEEVMGLLALLNRPEELLLRVSEVAVRLTLLMAGGLPAYRSAQQNPIAANEVVLFQNLLKAEQALFDMPKPVGYKPLYVPSLLLLPKDYRPPRPSLNISEEEYFKLVDHNPLAKQAFLAAVEWHNDKPSVMKGFLQHYGSSLYCVDTPQGKRYAIALPTDWGFHFSLIPHRRNEEQLVQFVDSFLQARPNIKNPLLATGMLLVNTYLFESISYCRKEIDKWIDLGMLNWAKAVVNRHSTTETHLQDKLEMFLTDDHYLGENPHSAIHLLLDQQIRRFKESEQRAPSHWEKLRFLKEILERNVEAIPAYQTNANLLTLAEIKHIFESYPEPSFEFAPDFEELRQDFRTAAGIDPTTAQEREFLLKKWEEHLKKHENPQTRKRMEEFRSNIRMLNSFREALLDTLLAGLKEHVPAFGGFTTTSSHFYKPFREVLLGGILDTAGKAALEFFHAFRHGRTSGMNAFSRAYGTALKGVHAMTTAFGKLGPQTATPKPPAAAVVQAPVGREALATVGAMPAAGLNAVDHEDVRGMPPRRPPVVAASASPAVSIAPPLKPSAGATPISGKAQPPPAQVAAVIAGAIPPAQKAPSPGSAAKQ